MKCDICKISLSYKTHIYKKPEMIYFCLDCAKEHIDDEQIKNEQVENWVWSKYK